MKTLEELQKMMLHHDFTYDYSDDYEVWKRGFNNLKAIEFEARNHPREVVVKMWNEIVDMKVIKEVAKDFYWS